VSAPKIRKDLKSLFSSGEFSAPFFMLKARHIQNWCFAVIRLGTMRHWSHCRRSSYRYTNRQERRRLVQRKFFFSKVVCFIAENKSRKARKSASLLMSGILWTRATHDSTWQQLCTNVQNSSTFHRLAWIGIRQLAHCFALSRQCMTQVEGFYVSGRCWKW
jgi:hypothetical protein